MAVCIHAEIDPAVRFKLEGSVRQECKFLALSGLFGG